MSTHTLNPIFDSFALHDQEGIPLTAHLMNAEKSGVVVNLATFACDALFAGWTLEKTLRTIAHACNDNGIPFDQAQFGHKINILWIATGRKPDPECWKGMKDFIISKVPQL